MITNVLLQTQPVGKAPPSTYDLPAFQHSYGKSCQVDKSGAREACDWSESLKADIEWEEFRAKSGEKKFSALPHEVDARFSYGKKSPGANDSTAACMAGWLECDQEIRRMPAQKQKLKPPGETASSKLMAKIAADRKKEQAAKPMPWTMKKFQNIKGKGY